MNWRDLQPRDFAGPARHVTVEPVRRDFTALKVALLGLAAGLAAVMAAVVVVYVLAVWS